MRSKFHKAGRQALLEGMAGRPFPVIDTMYLETADKPVSDYDRDAAYLVSDRCIPSEASASVDENSSELIVRASVPTSLLEGRSGPIRVATVASLHGGTEPVPFYTVRLDRPVHWEGSDIVDVTVRLGIGGDK